jgi:hypothetical protein
MATVVAVSDGVGSAPDATRGSAAACAATIRSADGWRRAGFPEGGSWTSDLGRTWEALVAPANPADCQATCLVAVARSSGVLTVATVGDGLVLVRRADGGIEWMLGPRGGGFAGDTEALGGRHRWQERSTRWAPGDIALMATDGVADDLVPELAGDFAGWLVTSFADLPARLRWRAIASELRAWPTPGHQDDKTIVVLMACAEAPA